MLLLIRYIPSLTVITLGLIFLLLFYKPTLFGLLLSLCILIVCMAVFLIVRKSYNIQIRTHPIKTMSFFLILPLLFTLSAFVFIIFINNIYIYSGITAAFAFLLYLYFEDLFLYLYHPMKYNLGTLENISEYISIITVFLTFSSFFGLMVFVKFPLWPMVGLSLIIIILLTRQMLFINKVYNNLNNLFILITALVVTETFSVISQLPSSFYVNGLLLAIIFFIINGINKSFLVKSMSKKFLFFQISLGIIIIISVIVTAQWT